MRVSASTNHTVRLQFDNSTEDPAQRVFPKSHFVLEGNHVDGYHSFVIDSVHVQWRSTMEAGWDLVRLTAFGHRLNEAGDVLEGGGAKVYFKSTLPNSPIFGNDEKIPFWILQAVSNFTPVTTAPLRIDNEEI